MKSLMAVVLSSMFALSFNLYADSEMHTECPATFETSLDDGKNINSFDSSEEASVEETSSVES